LKKNQKITSTHDKQGKSIRSYDDIPRGMKKLGSHTGPAEDSIMHAPMPWQFTPPEKNASATIRSLERGFFPSTAFPSGILLWWIDKQI
jgi:hypothetical protein